MKTYYFEDHIKISDHKPVEGYVEAYNGENKIFEGHNLVVDAGRKLIKNYIMSNLHLFYGNSNNATTPKSITVPDSTSAYICPVPSPNNELFRNNITITRTGDADLVVTLNIVIEPKMGESFSIQELGTFFDNGAIKTLFSRITFPPIPLTTDPITFIYKLYF